MTNSVPYYPVKCPVCESFCHSVKRRRMNTAYNEPESNFMLSCLSCFDLSELDWGERWAEYRSGLL